jgi:hypothetical protein
VVLTVERDQFHSRTIVSCCPGQHRRGVGESDDTAPLSTAPGVPALVSRYAATMIRTSDTPHVATTLLPAADQRSATSSTLADSPAWASKLPTKGCNARSATANDWIEPSHQRRFRATYRSTS